MMQHFRKCRLCGQQDWEQDMVHYSTRAYAHFACFAERKTAADIEALSFFDRRAIETWIDDRKPGGAK